ncbi:MULTISPECIES: urease accessory protein UreF [unclassified Yoonia]|uniref:urease accessory protein UreF n=1 Tax=unclassified Yoonia TaxID=2629118 RepID=UPI002AFE6A1A|nr:MULTISPECIES: urease accessory UreF family protein [unclassified Yoonia]
MRDAQLLTLAQWLSPAYPVGAFAWSHGLERTIGRGDLSGADDLAQWLSDVLDHGAGRADAILLCAAHAADDVAPVAELAAVLAPSRERRMETLQQGAAFAATTRAVWGLDLPDMAYPVAVGRAARLMDLPVAPVTQLWLQSFASNLVQAAQRLMPLGQTEAQRILASLAPLCIRIGAEATVASLDDIGSAVFAVDTASMQHSSQYSRIFRS